MATATTKLATVLNFGTLSGHTGTIQVSHVALYSALTVGTLKLVARVGGMTPYTIPISPGSSLSFPVNSLVFRCLGANGGVIGDAQALAILDALCGTTTLGPATYYAALMSASPTGAGGGTEFPGTGTYARVSITNNATNFPGAALL